ncbi:nucleoside-triphosphatase [Winogradskyella sp. HB-48]|uniref:nucleoside-triphosphatase n=1 Tax=Winogradskyella sp. HB-48 TaxID=3416808 RepID=UPI003CF2C0A0
MIYIVSGKIESGKSSFLYSWIENKSNISGILCLKDSNYIRHIYDIKSKDIFRIQTNNIEETTISIGRFHFLKSAFKKANTILKRACTQQDTGFIIIDELGKLELENKGLHPSAQLIIEKTRNNENLHSILVIRTTLFNSVLKHYDITDYKTLK